MECVVDFESVVCAQGLDRQGRRCRKVMQIVTMNYFGILGRGQSIQFGRKGRHLLAKGHARCPDLSKVEGGG